MPPEASNPGANLPAPMPALALPTPLSAASAAPPPITALTAAAAPASTVYPLPEYLREQLNDLAAWREILEKEESRDRKVFYLLKLLALPSAAFATLFTFLKIELAGQITAATAALAIAIDTFYPAGRKATAASNAVYELAQLQHDIKDWWIAGRLDRKDPDKVGKEIMTRISDHKTRLTRSLRDAAKLA